MKQVAEKLCGTEKTLSKKHGPFDLFAIFLREDAPDVWDLVVAADWIEQNRSDALRVISKRVQQDLTPNELTKISRVVLIDRTDPALHAVTSAIGTVHNPVEIGDSNFFGLQIKEAFVITSQKRKAA